DRGYRRADGLQLRQQDALLFRRLAWRRCLIALSIDGGDLLLDDRHARNLPRDLGPEPGRQWPAIARHKLLELQLSVLRLDIDVTDALGEQQALDAIDVRCSLVDQPAAFAMRAPHIFFVDAGDAHNRPHMAVATQPGDQRAQEHADIDPIRLRPAPAPVTLQPSPDDNHPFNSTPHYPSPTPT